MKASDLLCVDTCFSLTPHNFSLTFFLYFDHTVDEHTTTLAISFDLFYSLSVIITNIDVVYCPRPFQCPFHFRSQIGLHACRKRKN